MEAWRRLVIFLNNWPAVIPVLGSLVAYSEEYPVHHHEATHGELFVLGAGLESATLLVCPGLSGH